MRVRSHILRSYEINRTRKHFCPSHSDKCSFKTDKTTSMSSLIHTALQNMEPDTHCAATPIVLYFMACLEKYQATTLQPISLNFYSHAPRGT